MTKLKNNDNQRLGRRLRQVRETRGLSQSGLGEAVGVGKAAISHMEVGRYLPSVEVLIRLADVMKCSVDDLLNRRGVRSKPLSNKALENLLQASDGLSARDLRLLTSLAEAMSQE